MREMGEEYRGREQTWLKHRVLEKYLAAWSHKLGSNRGRTNHLWYVDGFAGPWQSQHEAHGDTSIAIGLRALNDAARTWARAGHQIALHAVFVEKDRRAFQTLRDFAGSNAGSVDVHTFEGPLGDHVDTIDRLVGSAPAFVFVDPTGWDGAALRFITTLGRGRLRDVMVNFMYNHINRFKDDERAFLRSQMREFFGLNEADLPPGLREDELMAFYRQRLREGLLRGEADRCWVADLAVSAPTKERTQFRLVVAGHHPMVIQLFRDVEASVIGKDAAQIRVDASTRDAEARSGQLTLLPPPAPPTDSRYASRRLSDLALARQRVLDALNGGSAHRFGDLWPDLLCEAHITLSDLKDEILKMEREGLLNVRGRGSRQRSLHDDHLLTAHPAGPPRP